jgi:hypothetical protein
MIAVALVGGLFAAVVEVRRLSKVSLKYRRQAELFRLEEDSHRRSASRLEALRHAVAVQASIETAVRAKKLEELGSDLEEMGRQGRHLAALRRKYERAASRPWEPLPPDPPPPK